MALAGHPKLAAARSRVLAAQHRVPQAKSLEDPMLDNMFWPFRSNSLETVGGRMQNQIGISQQVPWPEKLQARAAVACREVQIAQAEVESIEREITESVRLAYYEVWLAQTGTKIVLENQKLVADLIRVAEARYKAGGSQQDVLNAEIQRERLAQQLLELASQRAAAQAELAAYVQQPQSFSLQTAEHLSIDDLPSQLDVLIAMAEQCNPELRGLAYQIQRDLQKQRLANLERYSDFQLGTQYGFMTSNNALSPFADGKDMISFSVGMTLPVYRDKIRGGINEASANRASTAQMRQSEQLTIGGRLRRLLSEIDALDQQRTLYQERIIPRADQALKIALSEYAVGKTSFVQLTDNYSELLMYQLQVATIESTLAGRLAQLQRTVGCP
jgi:outer membrane protein TolC